MAGVRMTVITTIYAPNAAMEPVVLASLKATDTHFPDDERIAGVDAATPAIEAYCRDHGWTVLRPPRGRPPRMGTLLRLALERCETPLFWTIEHDVEVRPDAREALPPFLAQHPELAGVEAMTVNATGDVGYPTCAKVLDPMADPNLLSPRFTASLCCVCWRAEALKGLDWTRIPNYPATDKVISRQLRKAGWELAIAPCATAFHHFSGARRWLPNGWREHIGRAM